MKLRRGVETRNCLSDAELWSQRFSNLIWFLLHKDLYLSRVINHPEIIYFCSDYVLSIIIIPLSNLLPTTNPGSKSKKESVCLEVHDPRSRQSGPPGLRWKWKHAFLLPLKLLSMCEYFPSYACFLCFPRQLQKSVYLFADNQNFTSKSHLISLLLVDLF